MAAEREPRTTHGRLAIGCGGAGSYNHPLTGCAFLIHRNHFLVLNHRFLDGVTATTTLHIFLQALV